MFLKVHGKKLRGRKSISIKTPIEDVLICSAIFYGAGMDLSVILDVLNSILK